MPHNGESNTQFGVYRSTCCGQEIVIRAGATFPDCSNHRHLITAWEPVEVDIIDLTAVKKKIQSDSAA